jgi:hypothetical protein
MPLEGSLRDFSLPDLFQLLHFGKKNGTLDLVNGEQKGYVCFRNGNVFFATHNFKRPPLGQRLIEAGMVTEDQIEEALDLQKTTRKGERMGNIMVELGYLSRESLEVFVEEQIRDAVFHLLRWTEGEFDFNPNEVFPEEDIGLSMSTGDLILEGSRRLDEWFQIEKKVPSLETVFEMTEVPDRDSGKINLTSEEWLVLYHVDGRSSVRDIIEESKQSALVTCRALFGLVTAGLVRRLSDEEVGGGGVLEEEVRQSGESAGAVETPGEISTTGVPGAEAEPEEEPACMGGEVEEEEDAAAKEFVREETGRKKPGGRRGRPKKKAARKEKNGDGAAAEEEEAKEPDTAGEEEAPIVHEETGESPEDKKRTEPATGQSLVDYYKCLAMEEATDTDRLVAFRDTQDKEAVEATVQPSAGAEAGESEFSYDEEVPEYVEPDEIPLEWAGHLKRLRGGKLVKKARESLETEALEPAVEEVEEETPFEEAEAPVSEELPEAAEGFMTMEQEVEAQAFEETAGVEEEERIAFFEEDALEQPETAPEGVPPSKEEAPTAGGGVPTGKDIEELPEDTPRPTGEPTGEELLEFDEPTYPTAEAEEAYAGKIEEEIEDSDAREETAKKTPPVVEVEPEKKKGLLGRVLKFGRQEVPGSPEVELEEPEPIVDREEADIEPAVDLGITAGEALEAGETAAGEVEPEVTARALDEEIPLVDSGSLKRDRAESVAAEEPGEAAEDKSETVEIVGLEDEGAQVIPIESARTSPDVAEVLDVSEQRIAVEEIVDETPPAAIEPDVVEEAAADEVAGAEDHAGVGVTAGEPPLLEDAEEEVEGEVYVEEPPLLDSEAEGIESRYADEVEVGAVATEDFEAGIAEAGAESADEAAKIEVEAVAEEPEQSAGAAEASAGEGAWRVPEMEDEEISMGLTGELPAPGAVERMPAETALEEEEISLQELEVLRELSREAPVEEPYLDEIPEEVVEEPPLPAEATGQEEPCEEDEDGGLGSALKVRGKRGRGTSLIDLETFELEQELLELAGSKNEEKKRRPVVKEDRDKSEAREKEKRSRPRGKEVDKGSVKKIIDDLRNK